MEWTTTQGTLKLVIITLSLSAPSQHSFLNKLKYFCLEVLKLQAYSFSSEQLIGQ